MLELQLAIQIHLQYLDVACWCPSAVWLNAAYLLQALQYLRKLCSHPLLVLDPGVEAHLRAVGQALGQPPSAVQAQWAASLGQLHSLEHAPKMNALLELLQQCGIAPLPSDAALNTSGEHHVH